MKTARMTSKYILESRNISFIRAHLPVKLTSQPHRPFVPRTTLILSRTIPLGSTSSDNASTDDNPSTYSTLREEARDSNREVYDRLIDVFSQRSTEDWRKLIAFSKQWPSLAPGVFERLDERISILDQGSDEQRNLKKIARRLKIVSDEMADYAALMEIFRKAPSRDWEGLVAQKRSSLGQDFFNYMELRISAAGSAAAAATAAEQKTKKSETDQGSASTTATASLHKKEADALAALGSQVAALVEAHDRIISDETALESAQTKFAELLQAASMEDAEAKLDELASSGRLDPALLLTMAKAYAGVKETDATKEEVKDIMAHLYFKAKESFAQQAPVEVRILKFLLAVESPGERATLLEQSFQPGPEISTVDQDHLFTTPERMLNTITNVLGMYDGAAESSGRDGMAGQAAALMNPEVILRLRELQEMIRQNYT